MVALALPLPYPYPYPYPKPKPKPKPKPSPSPTPSPDLQLVGVLGLASVARAGVLRVNLASGDRLVSRALVSSAIVSRASHREIALSTPRHGMQAAIGSHGHTPKHMATQWRDTVGSA